MQQWLLCIFPQMILDTKTQNFNFSNYGEYNVNPEQLTVLSDHLHVSPVIDD